MSSSSKKGMDLRRALIVAKWWEWSVVAVAWLRRRPVASAEVPPLDPRWGRPSR